MSISDAIAALTSDTEDFLRSHRLTIHGGGPSSFDGAANFKMEVHPAGGFKAKYVTQTAAPLGLDEFHAWYVPMQQLEGFTANWLPSPEQSALGLMLTSQITGCLFGVGVNNGSTCVAHIQPNQSAHKNSGVSPKQARDLRQSDMRMNARIGGLKTFVAGGTADPKSSYSIDFEQVTVVGVRNEAGGWKIFSQKSDRTTNSITGIHSM